MSHYSADFGRALATAMHAQREAVFAQQEVEHLRADLAQRTAERDEARRKWCELASAFGVSIITAKGIAKERGWDCFDAKEGEP